MKLIINTNKGTLECIPQKSDDKMDPIELETRLAHMLSMTLATIADRRFINYYVKRSYLEIVYEDAVAFLDELNSDSMTGTNKLISMIFNPDSIDDNAGYGNKHIDDNNDEMF